MILRIGLSGTVTVGPSDIQEQLHLRVSLRFFSSGVAFTEGCSRPHTSKMGLFIGSSAAYVYIYVVYRIYTVHAQMHLYTQLCAHKRIVRQVFSSICKQHECGCSVHISIYIHTYIYIYTYTFIVIHIYMWIVARCAFPPSSPPPPPGEGGALGRNHNYMHVSYAYTVLWRHVCEYSCAHVRSSRAATESFAQPACQAAA